MRTSGRLENNPASPKTATRHSAVTAMWVGVFRAITFLALGGPLSSGITFDGATHTLDKPLVPLSTSNLTAVVPKTVHSSTLRLLFAVGLEGVGHHYFFQAVDDVFTRHNNLVRLNKCDLAEPYYLTSSMSQSVSHYEEQMDQARRQMRALKGLILPDGSVATMQGANLMSDHVHCEDIGGMLSYPHNPGPDKVLQYVDLRMLAEAAEAEYVDLRVVYLQRSAKDLIISNTAHRHFQGGLGQKDGSTPKQLYMRYMRIVFTNIAVIHSFLDEIDPAFVMCHRFDRMGDMKQATVLGNFIGPNEKLAELFRDSLVRRAQLHHDAKRESGGGRDDNAVATRFQLKLDIFESRFCLPEPN